MLVTVSNTTDGDCTFLFADGVRGVLQHGHVLLVGRQDVLALPRGAGKTSQLMESERGN